MVFVPKCMQDDQDCIKASWRRADSCEPVVHVIPNRAFRLLLEHAEGIPQRRLASYLVRRLMEESYRLGILRVAIHGCGELNPDGVVSAITCLARHCGVRAPKELHIVAAHCTTAYVLTATRFEPAA